MARRAPSMWARVALAAALVGLAQVPCWQSAPALDASPFDNVLGRWVGEGRLGTREGTTEDVKCRVTYLLPQPAAALKQTIRCASASGSIEIQSSVAYAAGRLAGTWRELSRDMGGDLTGTVTPRGFHVMVRGDSLRASMDIVVNGNKQIIEVQFMNGALLGLTLVLERG